MRTFRPRFVKPFVPLLTETQMNCSTCGIFIKPGSRHQCGTIPNCPYPPCQDKQDPHSPLMCRYIRAWCLLCQKRGHLAEQHQTLKLPPPYLWALFAHYQCIHLDTSYMMKNRKFENPFFHMFTLYGLPPSKIPKAAFETAVEQDIPDDPRFQRPVALPDPFPQFPASDFVVPSEQNVPQPPVSMTNVQPSVKRVSRLVQTTITRYDLRQACELAERISRGDVAGTSGSLSVSDPLVTELVRFCTNLKRTGTVPFGVSSRPADLIDLTTPLPVTETSSQPGGQVSSSAPTVAGSSQGQVVQNKQGKSSTEKRTTDVDQHANDSDSSISSVPSDRVVIDTETASQSSEDEDQSGVTRTATGRYYDNQEHILDRPITEEELEAAISPVRQYVEQPPKRPNPN